MQPLHPMQQFCTPAMVPHPAQVPHMPLPIPVRPPAHADLEQYYVQQMTQQYMMAYQQHIHQVDALVPQLPQQPAARVSVPNNGDAAVRARPRAGDCAQRAPRRDAVIKAAPLQPTSEEGGSIAVAPNAHELLFN